MLDFLKKFKDACKSSKVHGEVGMWLLSQFVKKPASSSHSDRLFFRKSNLACLRDEKQSSYVKIVNVFLLTYAIDDITTRAMKYLECYKPAAGMPPTEFVKKLYTRALRHGLVYEENRVKSLFVEALEDAVCDNVP